MDTNKRVVEKVVGYNAAVACIRARAEMFDEANGDNRMVICKSGLRARDEDGSGEFLEARCTNPESATSLDNQEFEILTLN